MLNSDFAVIGDLKEIVPAISAEIRRLRAILHRARTEGLERQNREGKAHFVAWLRGKIAYVSMSRPEVGARLRAELAALLGPG